mmetsp:Transcript_43879/g.100288  ORF Transcript_43879/g.100288 Transcript_43879/m.100288 type:complete len:107 (+) Transcript_43879:44-364(+)
MRVWGVVLGAAAAAGSLDAGSPSDAYRAKAAAKALEELNKGAKGDLEAARKRRDDWKDLCSMHPIGSQSRAQCETIAKRKQHRIDARKATAKGYDEIAGHLRGMAG